MNTILAIIIFGMFRIIPLENLLGKIISEADFTDISPTNRVSYSWGDNIELNQWIVAKDKEISGKRSFGVENIGKYPLIWLVTPIEGITESINSQKFNGIKFIIASSSKTEYLNEFREKEIMPRLVGISEKFIEIIKSNKNTSIVKKDGVDSIKFRKIYNYNTGENKNETLDIWDAISLQFDLIINNNCLKF